MHVSSHGFTDLQTEYLQMNIDLHSVSADPLPPKVAKFSCWFQKMSNVLKHMKTRFSDLWNKFRLPILKFQVSRAVKIFKQKNVDKKTVCSKFAAKYVSNQYNALFMELTMRKRARYAYYICMYILYILNIHKT